MSDPLQPHRWQPTRLRLPLDFQARTLEWVAFSFSNAWKRKVKVKSLSRVGLSDPMDCSLPGSSVHGIFQASVLEWVAIAFSKKKKKKVYHLQPISSVLRPLAFLPVSLLTCIPFLYSSIFGLQYLKKWGLPRWLSDKESTCNAVDTRDTGSVSGSERSPGVGNGNTIQYSCLRNPMDRGTWWATDHQVAKN